MRLLTKERKISSFLLVACAVLPPCNVKADGDVTVLNSVSVGPMTEISRISKIDDAENKYERLPQAVKDLIGIRFFIVDIRSNKMVVGTSLAAIRVEMDGGSDKGPTPVPIGPDGHIDFSANEKNQARDTRILANVPSGFELQHRLFIRLPENGPVTTGYMRHAAHAFLEAYKPFAGIVFRTFIGKKEPNCFGMNFDEPRTVSIRRSDTSAPIWTSKKDTRIVVFFDDIDAGNDDSIVTWSGDTPPFFVAACLQDSAKSN